MGKFLLSVLFLGLVSLPVMAQDYPKAEVFGGYQYLRLGGDAGENLNGWNAAFTGNFSKPFGLAADFSGAYKTVSVEGVNVNAKVYSYTGGPVFRLNAGGKVDPFVHALIGGAHLTGSASGGGGSASVGMNGFTMMFGGGADVKLNNVFALRVPQVDWVYYRFSGQSESHNVRLSAGIVFRF
jgi:hypothetical protein